MSRHTNGVFRIWWLAVVTGCYSAPKPDCGFVCGPSGACPADYHCATDGHCHLDGSSDSAMCAQAAPPDAPESIDVPNPDTTPPTILATDPADAATMVALDKVITVQFSEPVTNVNGNTFTLNGGSTTGTIMPTFSGTFTFTPDAPLPAASQINVLLDTSITDLSGNALVGPNTFSFQTTP